MKIDKTTGILLVIVISLIVYIFLTSGNDKYQDKYAKQKQEIDSLSKCISALDIEHRKQDSLIALYQNQVKELEFKVDSTKNKITEIKKYYGKKIKDIGSYTSDELDSFFAERYSK
jgi:peptidoglycan hydrolase CwlO-like protein